MQIARAMVNKGALLGRFGQPEKEMEIYSSLLRQFENSDNPDILESVARAMVNKGVMWETLNQPEKEIEVYNDFLRRFEQSENQDILVLMARVIVNKGAVLGRLGQPEKVIEIYDDFLLRFEGSKNPDIMLWIARAMVNKGIAIKTFGQPEKEIEVYDDLLRRFKGSENQNILECVAKAMVNKGNLLGRLGQPEKGMEVYDDLLRRFEGSENSNILVQVTKALVNKGKTFIKKGQLEEAETAYRKVIEIKVDDAWIWENIIKSYFEQNLSEKALLLAKEAVNKNPKNSKLPSLLAWAFNKYNKELYLDQVENWAAEAVECEPENLSYLKTYIRILCDVGKGREALEAASKLVQIPFSKEDIFHVADLFIKLAGVGKGQEGLAFLINSPNAKMLEPLVVGLKLF